MTIVATDPPQTRSVASRPVRYQVARAAFAGALSAVGVVALSAAALALFFGLVPTNPIAVSSQLADGPGIIASPPDLPGSNLATISQSDRDAKPVIAELTSRRVAPVQETAATQALPVPPEALAGAVSSSADLLSPTPFEPQPVAIIPAALVQTGNTSVEPVELETAATRTVVTKARAAVADKKATNPVPERISAVAPIKKAAHIAPLHATALTQPRGTEAIHARPEARSSGRSSPELQHHKVPTKPMVAKAATAVTDAEATAPPAQAAPASAETVEAEATEVFGLKVPSLAPAGRKIRESVEALGVAVKNLPDRF